mmetsp:Transcript_3242/g.6893  ORF Transcript_3242/g.6893 Transcript_3242/m.6893 type:complete len:171 (+) Transcript_3242:85-597(+)
MKAYMMVSPLPFYLIAICPIEGLHITDDNAKSHGVVPLVSTTKPTLRKSRSFPPRRSSDPFAVINYESDFEDDYEEDELLCESRWETTPSLDGCLGAAPRKKTDQAPVLKRRSLSEMIKTTSTAKATASLPRCPRRRSDNINFLLGDQQRGDNFNDLLSKALEAGDLVVH